MMPWTLRVYDETGETLQQTLTSADPIPTIHGGFRITVRSTGDCVSMTFRGRNDLLQIKPRQIVQFLSGSQPLFWGPIMRCPNIASSGAGFDDGGMEADLEEFVAEGGRTMLAASSSGARYVETSEEVADIFREFLTLYGPPRLFADLTQTVNTNADLSLFYKPNSPLDVLFDELVATVPGWVWGVDATGTVFLKELAGILSFQADTLVDFTLRPISAEELTTKVNLVIAGSPSGRVPEYEDHYHNDPTLYDSGVGAESSRLMFDYVPVPVVFTAEHPLHSVFRAERSFALPEGLAPFLEPADAAAVTGVSLSNPSGNWVDTQEMHSNNSATSAFTDEATWPTLQWSYLAGGDNPIDGQAIVGFRLVYSAEFASAAFASPDPRLRPHARVRQLVVSPATPNGPVSTFSPGDDYASVADNYYALTSTQGDAERGAVGLYGITPFPAHFHNLNRSPGTFVNSCYVTISIGATNAVGRSRLYHFYPLVLNAALLQEVAESNFKVPRSMSGDVVVRGYSPPVPVVEILNLFGEAVGSPPSVDMVESVETVQYQLDAQDGFVTRYSMGNDSVSDAGKLLQRYVRDGITAANYALTMS